MVTPAVTLVILLSLPGSDLQFSLDIRGGDDVHSLLESLGHDYELVAEHF